MDTRLVALLPHLRMPPANHARIEVNLRFIRRRGRARLASQKHAAARAGENDLLWDEERVVEWVEVQRGEDG